MVLESVDTMRPVDDFDSSWPIFTADVESRYAFFVTHREGVNYLSLSHWTERLEKELNGNASTGAAFRIEVFTEGSRTLREQIAHRPFEMAGENSDTGSFTGSIVLQDSDLGYFLLTAAGEQPYAITFDLPDSELPEHSNGYQEPEYEPDMKMPAIGPLRPAYQPPASLWAKSALSNFLESRVHSRHRKTFKEEIRLSAATLDLMTEAHRVLSHETHQLGVAAADLFRRCERLQDEFRDQIRRASDLTYRIEQVADEGADDYEEKDRDRARGNAAIEQRLEAARERQEQLVERHKKIRRALAKTGGKDLSHREQLWMFEMRGLEHSVFEMTQGTDQTEEDHIPAEPWRRYEEVGFSRLDMLCFRPLLRADLAQVKELTEDLVAQAHQAAEGGSSDVNGVIKVPPELRKAKVTQVMGLLERECVLSSLMEQRHYPQMCTNKIFCV